MLPKLTVGGRPLNYLQGNRVKFAVRVPVDGYGIAPSRQGGGAATRAVASLVEWARGDERIERITANTGVDNVPSQRVLERNGFLRVGEDVDPDDGPVICWELRLK